MGAPLDSPGRGNSPSSSSLPFTATSSPTTSSPGTENTLSAEPSFFGFGGSGGSNPSAPASLQSSGEYGLASFTARETRSCAQPAQHMSGGTTIPPSTTPQAPAPSVVSLITSGSGTPVGGSETATAPNTRGKGAKRKKPSGNGDEPAAAASDCHGAGVNRSGGCGPGADEEEVGEEEEEHAQGKGATKRRRGETERERGTVHVEEEGETEPERALSPDHHSSAAQKSVGNRLRSNSSNHHVGVTTRSQDLLAPVSVAEVVVIRPRKRDPLYAAFARDLGKQKSVAMATVTREREAEEPSPLGHQKYTVQTLVAVAVCWSPSDVHLLNVSPTKGYVQRRAPSFRGFFLGSRSPMVAVFSPPEGKTSSSPSASLRWSGAGPRDMPPKLWHETHHFALFCFPFSPAARRL